MAAGKTIEVSRWVTSGDWSNDDEEMTITISEQYRYGIQM